MPKDKDLLGISILSTITILIWITVEAYITYKNTQLTEVPQQISAPFNPYIDFSIIK